MRRALILVTACVLLAVRAPAAFGQCSISTLEINGVVTLCADTGDAWEWSGPGGFTSNAFCIDALTDGVYTLRIFDAATSTWSAPCSTTVGNPPTGPSCSITGPDSVCADATVTWCGPSGDLDYAWSGPGGWTATTSCVALSVPGTYTLELTDRATGAKGEPCTQTLRAVDCTPPPPPDPERPKCPASARWWSRACDEHSQSVSPETFARLASMVDARSAVWSYDGETEGLCNLLSLRRHGKPFRAARRHFAAVHANMCASELDVRDASGRQIGLDPDMTLDHVPGVEPGTTLRAWAAATEEKLVAMSGDSWRNRRSNKECRRITREARAINAGTGACGGSIQAALDDEDEDDDDDLDTDSGSGAFSVTGGGSNPFAGGNRMRWTLERTGQVQLDVIDLSGRRVRRLAAGTYSAGSHEFQWDGRDDGGRPLRAGAYFVVGRVDETRVGHRLILLR